LSIKFGIIGGGVMGEALLSRLLSRELYRPQEVLVSDPNADRLQTLEKQYGVGVTSDNNAAAGATEVLLLAIKPQLFDRVTADLPTPGTAQQVPVVISILAGVPLSKLSAAFPEVPTIRVMPNTPATVGAGMSAIAAGPGVEPHHLERAKQVLQAVGETIEVPESLMDAVTGVSGSGPGYVAILIEALTDGGVCAGLPRAIAAQLALQTVLGTATLMHENSLHPAELKDRVTSPGGTTIAGIAALEKAGFRSAIIEAVQASAARSKELGK
jgi:pyrroline-5-carboxylate reductase